MPKLVDGYTAIFREASIDGGFCGDRTGIKQGTQGELTIWKSEHLHPGERFVKFVPEGGEGLQTSCGEITVEDGIFTICTQDGKNQYVFELVRHVQTVEFRMKYPERFLHICSGCGKRELLSSKDAYEQGWDYPGPDGIYKDMPNCGFGILLPRTCGSCGIEKSLYWKLTVDKDSNTDSVLSEEIREALERIQNEPMSLMVSAGEPQET